MSLKAYQTAAQRAESPRDVEYRLFVQVTRALMEAASAPPNDLQTRVAALDWNRRVWAALAADCANPANSLPKELRAGIVSLSLFVNRQTSETIRSQGSLDILIEVNRTIMQGLNPTSAPEPQGRLAA